MQISSNKPKFKAMFYKTNKATYIILVKPN